MKKLLALSVVLFGWSALATEPQVTSDVQARLDQIEQLHITAQKGPDQSLPADAQVAKLLAEAAQSEQDATSHR